MLHFILVFIISSVFAGNSFRCKTSYDQLNIPHIEAESTEGFYYCFGLQHGQDRAWQMDYFRRVAQGRNAEVLGFAHLKSDLMMRLLNLTAKAQSLWNEFPADKKVYLEWYSNGVNEGFKTGKKAFEFTDKGFTPEDWKPVDSLSVLLLQSFDQTRKTFFSDYEEQLALEAWGDKAPELFDQDQMPWENTILKDGEYPKKTEVKTSSHHALKFHPKLWANFPTVLGLESGSNNWVVSSKKSKTKNAIFANDPHLDLKTPMFWYWLQLQAPGSNILGGSLPGIPVIVSGTNGKVAWGLTNAYYNSADAVFIKDLKPEGLNSIRPTVWIKFLFFKVPFFFKSFERLISGEPILPLETETAKKIALRWSGFTLMPSDIFHLFDLHHVSNVSEMDESLKKIGVPAWNFVFADQKGDIGFRLVGKIYRESSKTSFGIQTKTLSEFGSQVFLSPEDRPHVLKPRREYVYTANNRHFPGDAEFYGGRAYSDSFRGNRIDEMLNGVHDSESFKKIQCDRKVLDAPYFLPLLQKYLGALEFSNWSMIASDESKALPVYRRLMDLIKEKWKVNEYALFRLLPTLTNEQINELKNFYQTALADVHGRNWGEFHKVKFPHLSKNESWVFSPEISGVGDNHSVDPGTAKWNEEKKLYEQHAGASMRLIIEMSDPVKVQLILPGFNRSYTSMSEISPWLEWKECRYHPIEFTKTN